MRLLVDVGNTAVKLAIEDQGNIKSVREQEVIWSAIDELVYGQVGKSSLLEPLLASAAQCKVDVYQASVTPQCAGVTCAYSQYQNFGVDRWLAVLAASQLFPNRDLIIIDSGTATTVDVVNKQGQHLGGWIAPGIDLMVNSITARAERVFCDEHTPFAFEFANNTPSAVKNGALAATVGLVYCARSLLQSSQPVILTTGGYGKIIQQQFVDAEFNPELVLKGLAVWRKFSPQI
ncbi:type III pantothenate kinase [Pseudoalteromonas sp. T1lg65]|uniref:type III pantothenate kinase n=1 Tax=Pseudoalteromonas sp. T1lg65 TaxID=2077101 RepID=UPI003F7A61BA